MSKNILVTGGTGYIGSHTVVELLNNNHNVTIIDNLSNSKKSVLDRIEKITSKRPEFHQIDLLDQEALENLFTKNTFDSVIHFAGLKAVGESVKKPLSYYSNNITGTLNLLECMERRQSYNLIFSSSATVYGTPESLPLTEDSRTGIGITNPYGWSKYMIEQIIKDWSVANPKVSATILRYFNPIGAHSSGLIGEDPNGIPNNLIPYIAQVATGKLDSIKVYGDNYDTPDGTGVRDYIHVVDLALGHLAAINHQKPGVVTYNLGTGTGTSVLEVIKAFNTAASKELPYQISPRRPGDIATNYASAEKALKELGWKSQKTVLDACRDTWNWQQSNP